MKSFLPFILSFFGIILSYSIYKKELNTSYNSTLAPFFQILGKPIRSANKALTKMIPINGLDEKEYGDAIKLRYRETSDPQSKDLIYINDLIQNLTRKKNKPFDYEAFLLYSPVPNAFALPGGVIFVTTGLLETLESESELVAVLGHEIGHIEKSHCMDSIRFELIAKKIGAETLGVLADLAFQFFMRSSFSKTQEAESDEYAFELIQTTEYDPSGESSAFEKLKAGVSKPETSGRENSNHPILEYFQSHPYLELRIQKYKDLAKRSISLSENKEYYIGLRNYQERRSFYSETFPEEYKRIEE